MLFTFYTYIQPVHYFSILKKEGTSVFPKVEALPETVTKVLVENRQYKSEIATRYDLSWQALQKGYIGTAPTHTAIEPLPLVDEYRFVRTYFNPLWVYYIFILRIVSLKNPIKELRGLYNSRTTKKSILFQQHLVHKGWENFNSPLVQSKPLVSVIIPTLNRYPYLKDVIEDLEKQDYPNFEVIIMDQTTPFQKDFYTQFSKPLRVFYQEEKALWLARNEAIKKAKGALYLLFDDDSRIEKNWITNHVKCLDFFKAAISSGTSISQIGAKVPENYSFFRISDQLDTGNVLIKKEVFEAVGLFDRQFEKQRMGDGEFGLRSHLAGFLNISNPYAERLHLKVGTGGLRQMGSWDGYRPKNWWGPRPIPSVLYYFRKYHGNKRAVLALLRSVPPSLLPYRFKKNKALFVFGLLAMLVLFPIVIFQVGKSWYLASKKIKEGAKISYL